MHVEIDPVAQIQEEFVRVLPVIVKSIDWVLLACPKAERAEAHQEAVALSWKRYRRLSERGKNPASFPSLIGRWAATHVLAGRRFVGGASAKDAMSAAAQYRHGFSLQRLDSRLAAALVADEKVNVAKQVAFRIDFPEWLSKMPYRDQRIAADMAAGHTTNELARKFEVCNARISQKRREFAASWSKYHAGALA